MATSSIQAIAEEMGKRFYEIHERLIFQRFNFAKSSLSSKLWKDLKERDRKEYIETFKLLLADQELMAMIKSRSEI